MKILNIHSKQEPNFSQSVEIYTVEYDGTKSESMWYSRIKTNDYKATRSMLEESGYTAYPANINEIKLNEFSIFKQA